jgi:hypothetical protein
MKHAHAQNGYVALMTAIILGLVLLTLLVVASNTSLFGRFNVLDAENKEISRAVARSCADIALLKYAGNAAYAGDEVLDIGAYRCYVRPADGSALQVQAVVRDAYTNLDVAPDGSARTECAYFDSVTSACVLPE